MSAYSCKPRSGSEAGVGWNVASGMAAHHDVWVVTRPMFRESIERELEQHPVSGLHFVYEALPEWLAWWRRGRMRRNYRYSYWQRHLGPTVMRLHREIGFDVAHHVTYARYWTPSPLAELGIPFVWGPIGGGESAPRAFWSSFPQKGVLEELVRLAARWAGEHDRAVQRTAAGTSHAIATNPETAAKLAKMKIKNVSIISASALSAADIAELGQLPQPPRSPVTFLSIGKLSYSKAYHLGLEAFARADLEDARYVIIGWGTEKERLERMAARLGISERVELLGRVPRETVFRALAGCHALVHPSLKESSGWVCAEAMAAGRPVICLDMGGPATQVSAATGFKISASRPEEAVQGIASAMSKVYHEPMLASKMGEAGRRHVRESLQWNVKTDMMAHIYEQLFTPAVAAESTIRVH